MKTPIWEPSKERQASTNINAFMDLVKARYNLKIDSYHELHRWSVDNLSEFWGLMWDFGEIKASKPYDTVMINAEQMIDIEWFPGSKLNFAENLLRYKDHHTAIIFKSSGKKTVKITYAELYEQVSRLAKSLREIGVKQGDVVAGFMPNTVETVVAMLAATSIGAIWSSCSPDFGIKGVLDRFGQIKPKVLFTADGYHYIGKSFDSLERVASILKGLDSVEKVIVVPYVKEKPAIDHLSNSVYYQDFLAKETELEIQFTQLAFNHPLYIMYTSGTTGLPKCMVQSAGGVLINHLKELKLHTDIGREDTVFYFTTCGWMMWNWLVSSLALGATIVLFDESPFYPNGGALWELAQSEQITVFGTSAKYITEVERRGLKPAQRYNLSALKTILSTGSPLPVESYHFVYRDIKADVLLASISGGSDINGCFMVGNPIGAVYAGELQCLGLGMDVQAFNSAGEPVFNQKGELVCRTPVPSMPLYFWQDQYHQKYNEAYFSAYPKVWCHGDYIEITNTGIIVHGRSDATLNSGGVRIGTAEIYRQVDSFAEIEDSVVVGQEWANDVRVILFVKLIQGVQITEEIITSIKGAIRKNTSPRHVPAKVIAVDGIPYTINMKKAELAVKNIIHSQPVLNRDALANPESLEGYKNLKELQS